jgi:hypothetical protein
MPDACRLHPAIVIDGFLVLAALVGIWCASPPA